MSRVVIMVVALVVGLALGGCGRQPATGAAPVTGPPARGASGPSTTAERPSSPAAAPTTRTLTVTIRGGQVSGDTGRVAVPLGSQVTLTVHSDVADEVHLHGYDKEAEIPAGGSVSISFTADIPGVFEVELHKSDKQLLQLQVS